MTCFQIIAKKIANKCGIKVGNVKKLVPNPVNKTNYVVYHRNLVFYHRKVVFITWNETD